MSPRIAEESAAALAMLLRGYSTEVTCGDRKSIEAAMRRLPPHAEVFIASLPADSHDRQIRVAAQ
jgi:hypothetical protein